LSLVASLNNNGIVFTNGKIFWCNDAYSSYRAIKKKLWENTVQIGKTSDIDDEQLDIMVSLFNGFPFDVELKHGRKMVVLLD
jgi:hypothetical protein